MSISRLLAIAAFTLAAALVASVEWAARREGSRIPTLGDLCAGVMRYRVGRVPVGRVAVLGLWWWLGWHFFAR
ncbi:DUF6186 family protein [Rhizomonospora bruguierae]|uniref:DUF6186 family protein n=1 Tax=Rhizomonospora bruguierae TaxID=1581705 RepID=UPI001BCD4385|nr:DUF6186 family protein [Micromonospora sp. NBRC 107566]